MNVFNILGSYDEAWKAIVMPPRQDYSIYDLGPNDINIKGKRIQRTDFRLLNKRGQTLECSFYQQTDLDHAIPCVIYLHANGCSRLEALQYLDTILSNQVNLFCFDFSGCGKSGGVYTSLGWFEQDDLECVIQYLTNTGKVTKIGVWGRSMGAITAILYAVKDPRITCYVFDSPFSKFKQLVKELAKEKASLPGFLSEGAFSIIRQTIKKKVLFDIDNLRPLKYVDKINVPALFGAGRQDTFVLPQHTSDLYSAYLGPKQIMLFEGDHNSQRPQNWNLLVKEFLENHLLKEEVKANPNAKTLKQLFDPMIDSTSLDIKKPSVSDKILSQQQQQPPPIQKSSSMNFSWLEHSASVPDLGSTHSTQSLQSLGLSDKDLRGGQGTNLELISQSKPKPAPEKPAEKRFGELFGEKHRAEVPPPQRAAPTTQKTYTIESNQHQHKEIPVIQVAQKMKTLENQPTPPVVQAQKTYTLDLSQKGSKYPHQQQGHSSHGQGQTRVVQSVPGKSQSQQQSHPAPTQNPHHHSSTQSSHHQTSTQSSQGSHDVKKPQQQQPQHHHISSNPHSHSHSQQQQQNIPTPTNSRPQLQAQPHIDQQGRPGISPKNLPNKPMNHPITYAQTIPQSNPQPHPHGLAKSQPQPQHHQSTSSTMNTVPTQPGSNTSLMSSHHNSNSMMNLHHGNSVMNSTRSGVNAGPSQVLQNKLSKASGNPGTQSSSSISIFGPKQIKARNEDIVHQQPFNPVLKDASLYRLNSAIGFGIQADRQKPNQTQPLKTTADNSDLLSASASSYSNYGAGTASNSYIYGDKNVNLGVKANNQTQQPTTGGHHVRNQPSISIDENQNSQYLPKKPQILQSRQQPENIFYKPSHVGQPGHMTQYMGQNNMRQPEVRRNTDNLIQPFNNTSLTEGYKGKAGEYNPNKSCHEMDRNNINLSTNLLSQAYTQSTQSVQSQPKSVKTLTVDLSQAGSHRYGQQVNNYALIK
jgi:pimeloyl-ACP methyl ester carboxylesterase